VDKEEFEMAVSYRPFPTKQTLSKIIACLVPPLLDCPLRVKMISIMRLSVGRQSGNCRPYPRRRGDYCRALVRARVCLRLNYLHLTMFSCRKFDAKKQKSVEYEMEAVIGHRGPKREEGHFVNCT